MKRLMFIIFIFILTSLLLTGCDTTMDVKRDYSTDVTLEFNKTNASSFGFETEENTDIDDWQVFINNQLKTLNSSLVVNAEKYKVKGNTHILNLNIVGVENPDYDAIFNKYAAGTTEDMLSAFGSYRYGDDYIDAVYENILDDIESDKLYAYDNNGNPLSEVTTRLLFEKDILAGNGAIYTDLQLQNIKYSLPGEIQLALSDNDNIHFKSDSSFTLGEEDFAFVIYKQPISAALPLSIFGGIFVIWFLIRVKATYNKRDV